MKEENENIEQRLEHLKSGRTFRVPENYFEDFAGRLRARIEAESKPVPRLSWFMYLKPALGIAAVLAIVFLLVYVPVNLSLTDHENTLTISQPINDSVNTDVNNNLPASYEALVQLPQSQFLSTLEEVVNQDDAPAIDPKALEEYLAANSFDYETIRIN